MGSFNMLPKSSSVLDVQEARLSNGVRTRMEYRKALVSDGYKSNYEHHEARFIVIRRQQPSGLWRSEVHRYSGKRLAEADIMWDKLLQAFYELATAAPAPAAVQS